MRQARSYSILDHQLLHGGHFQRLSHQALALYLFLAVVGDPEGKSYYRDTSICSILRLPPADLDTAKGELTDAALITYRKPYWWVMGLSEPIRVRGKEKIDPDPSLVSEAPKPIAGLVSRVIQMMRKP